MAQNGKKGNTQIAIVIGVILIVIGGWHLLSLMVPMNLLGNIASLIRGIWGIVWPCALVAIGGYLLYAAKSGKLSAFKQGVGLQGALRRSRADKRIFGVCGGLAYYFGIDSTVVRIVVGLLFVAFPLMVAIAYLLIALFVPQA